MKWSILITSLYVRLDDLKFHLGLLMDQVDVHKGDIEVIVLVDNAELSLGEKRSRLTQMAQGEFLCFVDDDDVVSFDYCDQIMDALRTDPDYVGFKVQLYWNGNAMKQSYHSMRNDHAYEDDNGYYRNVNHLNPMRSDIAKQFSFEGGFGEDSRWSDVVYDSGLIENEVFIDKVLYHYWHDTNKSLSQDDAPDKRTALPDKSDYDNINPSKNLRIEFV